MEEGKLPAWTNKFIRLPKRTCQTIWNYISFNIWSIVHSAATAHEKYVRICALSCWNSSESIGNLKQSIAPIQMKTPNSCWPLSGFYLTTVHHGLYRSFQHRLIYNNEKITGREEREECQKRQGIADWRQSREVPQGGTRGKRFARIKCGSTALVLPT